MYFKTFIKDESCLAIVEYAIAGALITAVLVQIFVALGNTVAVQISRFASLIP